MPTTQSSLFYRLALVLVVVAGLSLTYALTFALGADSLPTKYVLAIATGATGSLIVLLLQQYFPREGEEFKVVRGHARIYEEYKDALSSLDLQESHVVYTTTASPQSKPVAQEWDAFLTGILKSNPGVDYHRIVVYDHRHPSPEWSERLSDIHSRYAGLRNYIEYHCDGPPSIEFLAVDDSLVFFTFPVVMFGSESNGVLVRDRKVCKEIQTYAQHLVRILPQYSFEKNAVLSKPS